MTSRPSQNWATPAFHWLYYGPFRRLFRGVARRMLPGGEQAVGGYLRGHMVGSGMAQRLGVVELHVQKALVAALRPGDTFWDIGGHEGYYSLLGSASVGASGVVRTFEPSPPNADRIEQLLELNQTANCTIIRRALAAETGTATLYLPSASSQASLLQREGTAIEIQTGTVDGAAAEFGPPDVLKMDVEGFEISVLSGAKQLLAAPGRRVWVIEAHSRALATEARSILGAAGYAVIEIPAPNNKHRGSEVSHLLAQTE